MKLLDLFNEADKVKYPLGLFSILALAIILERVFTLYAAENAGRSGVPEIAGRTGKRQHRYCQ